MTGNIVVVSTGYNAPTKDRCLESVRAQKDIPYTHVYCEASADNPPKTVTQNLADMVCKNGWAANDIIVWLDGDDWLAGPNVLRTVQEMYSSDKTWITYGSYENADGRPGVTAPFNPRDFNPRHQTWVYSHLKTFRAGLFWAIQGHSLKRRSDWVDLAVDQAVMLPMLEMAGPEHVVFCPEVLYIYNYASSFEHRANTDMLATEAEMARWIRAQKPYEAMTWEEVLAAGLR